MPTRTSQECAGSGAVILTLGLVIILTQSERSYFNYFIRDIIRFYLKIIKVGFHEQVVTQYLKNKAYIDHSIQTNLISLRLI